MNITLEAGATLLNRHCITSERDIISDIKRDVVTEMEWTPVRAEHSYATVTGSMGPVVQAFQCDFTPNGALALQENMYTLQKAKIDLQFTCDDMEMWFDSWKCDWYESGMNPKEWSFPRYVYDKFIKQQIKHDIETRIAYKGLRVNPTTGIAGTVAGALNGFGKVLAEAITALKVPASNVITLGAFTASTYYDKLNQFVAAIPEESRNGGVIYMSEANARSFQMDVLAQFGNTGCCESSVLDPRTGARIVNMVLPFTNIRIKGLPSMFGQNRIIYSATPNNIIWGYRTGESQYPTLQWESNLRSLRAWGEFHRFYGARDWRYIFCNELA